MCPFVYFHMYILIHTPIYTYIYIDREKLHLAHYLMRLFILRRLKSEVEQKLPAKFETKINCHMTTLQLACIRKLLLNESSLLMRSESMDLSVADGKKIKSLLVGMCILNNTVLICIECMHLHDLYCIIAYYYMLVLYNIYVYLCDVLYVGAITKGGESSLPLSR